MATAKKAAPAKKAAAPAKKATGTPKPALKKAAPVLNDHHTASLKDGEIYWVITNGVSPAMPVFKTQLTDVQRWQIVLFVRSLATPHH